MKQGLALSAIGLQLVVELPVMEFQLLVEY